MAEIVMAYSASHAPMMTADPGSAPRQQAENFFSALEKVRDKAKETGVQAIVMMTGEHFTNFFLDGLPQIAIGLDDEHLGPPEVWLQVPKKMVPSRRRAGRAHHREPDRARPAACAVVRHEGRPRVHDRLLLARPDHGTADGADRAQLHDAAADDREAVLGLRRHRRQRDPLLRRSGAGGPRARAVGCRTSSASPGSGTSTRSSTAGSSTNSARGDLSEILALPNDVLMEAGNGTGEVRAWIALAAAMGSAPGQGARLRGRLRVDQRDGRRPLRRRPRRRRATRRAGARHRGMTTQVMSAVTGTETSATRADGAQPAMKPPYSVVRRMLSR